MKRILQIKHCITGFLIFTENILMSKKEIFFKTGKWRLLPANDMFMALSE